MKEQSLLMCALRAAVALMWIRLMLVFRRNVTARTALKTHARSIMTDLTLRLYRQ